MWGGGGARGAEGARIEAPKALSGSGVWEESVPPLSPMGVGSAPENFRISVLKMVRFDFILGLFFYNSAACFTHRITELMLVRFAVCYLYLHYVLYDECDCLIA